MRILLIEDDPILALTFASTLEQGGHEVLGIAYTAQEAYDVASTHPDADLALADVNLNGKDEGIEVVRELRTRFGIPALFVSGQVAVVQQHAHLALGLMKKPFPPADLLRAVQAVRHDAEADLEAQALPPALTLYARCPTGRPS
jgi:two-component system, response regulator PdtaR